jgi:hypothetical protein
VAYVGEGTAVAREGQGGSARLGEGDIAVARERKRVSRAGGWSGRRGKNGNSGNFVARE